MKKIKPVSLKEIYTSLTEDEKNEFGAAIKKNISHWPELPKDNFLEIWLSRRYWEHHEKVYPSDSFFHLTYDLTESDANMSNTKTNADPSSECEPTDEFDFYIPNNP